MGEFCTTNKQKKKFANPEAVAFLDNVCALSLFERKDALRTFNLLCDNLSENIKNAESFKELKKYYNKQWEQDAEKPWQNDFSVIGEEIRTDNFIEAYHGTLRVILLINSSMWTFAGINNFIIDKNRSKRIKYKISIL